MPAAPNDVPAGSRRVQMPGNYAFWIHGEEKAVLRDAYHTFLRLRWSASIGLIALGLLIANFFYAVIYYEVGGVEGEGQSFFHMFSFSVQTMATIGYGVAHAVSTAATCVMISEAIFGIIVTALATGLVFAKFARAVGRIQFTTCAVITAHEGKSTLMFRCGNRRSNTIIEAQLHVTAAFTTTTAEGRPFYKIHDLTLVRDRMSGLRRGWVVMHTIDETSPLHGMTAAELDKRECEINISLMGLDDVTLQTVHTLHTYSADQIRFGHHFADTIMPLSNGDLLLDMTQFDVLVPDERASVPA